MNASLRHARSTVSRHHFLRLASLFAFTLVLPVTGDEVKKVIPADQARDHIDETGTVEMTVKSSRDYEPSKVYYLNSEDDFRDEKCVSLMIAYADAPAFKKAGIDDPAAYYKGKTIRVAGKVIHESKQTRIHVTSPAQIELVGAPKG